MRAGRLWGRGTSTVCSTVDTLRHLRYCHATSPFDFMDSISLQGNFLRSWETSFRLVRLINPHFVCLSVVLLVRKHSNYRPASSVKSFELDLLCSVLYCLPVSIHLLQSVVPCNPGAFGIGRCRLPALRLISQNLVQENKCVGRRMPRMPDGGESQPVKHQCALR